MAAEGIEVVCAVTAHDQASLGLSVLDAIDASSIVRDDEVGKQQESVRMRASKAERSLSLS